jgi:hypothetical protein
MIAAPRRLWQIALVLEIFLSWIAKTIAIDIVVAISGSSKQQQQQQQQQQQHACMRSRM